MQIGGFQKTSLLDYPGEVSAIVWTVGCNFSCPFCYNKDLVNKKVEVIPEEEVLDYLKKRKKILDALAITGGEPLLQEDLAEFIQKVKKLGYKIKIDTNGTKPEKLKELIDKNLINYVAMDVKAPKGKYNKLSGVKTNIKKIEKSIEIIKESKIDYEFRTTFVSNLLKKEDVVKIAKWLNGANRFYLQQFKNDVPLISPKTADKKLYDSDYLKETLKEIKPYFTDCKIRGD